MNEIAYRLISAFILLTCIGISFYYRRKADRDTGEKISRSVDGKIMSYVIKIGGVFLWLSPLAWLINPDWMQWSKIGLAEWGRLAGIMIGILCTGMVYWLFNSIGSGISPTSATRHKHKLVTTGPYRRIRHPLYTFGTALFISFGMMADNWFIIFMGILAFLAMAIRTPKEEAGLIEKFGDEYRQYMKITGKYFPSLKKRGI